MNRAEFLTQHWKAYPSIFNNGESFFFGRVSEVGPDFIKVTNQDSSSQLAQKDLIAVTDSHYGLSVSLQQLIVGDSVVFSKNQSAVFLLSPCLVADPDFLSWQAKEWSCFLESVAKFFKGKSFLHLQTPNLVISPGVDHHIDFLQVEGIATGRCWCLPTSPEIHLKKYLCQGYDRIFEIKNCFRDDLVGENHKVEFTMLEWYRAYASLEDIRQDVTNLLQHLVPGVAQSEVLRVSEVFKEYLKFDLSPQTSRDELFELARALEVDCEKNDDWNDLFFRLFMEKVEPHLGVNSPLFLTHFPVQQASLSQLDSEGWSQRFELYWQGVELANAYLEVNDPVENRQRFLAEQSLRETKGATVAGLDEDFFKKMDSGMPPASGIALGLDRLFGLIQRGSGSES